MYIRRLVIKNYKLLNDVEIDLNPDTTIFVGNNDSGKSTLLEALSILTTGKLDGYAFERQLKTVIFNNEARATCYTYKNKRNMPKSKNNRHHASLA